jgi:hypothetical protein
MNLQPSATQAHKNFDKLVADEKNFINVQTASNLLDVLNYLEI